MLMKNPITYRYEERVPISLLALQLVEGAVYGVALGALGACVFRAYSYGTGAAMGVGSGIMGVVTSRIWSNAGYPWNALDAERSTAEWIIPGCISTARLFAPFLGRRLGADIPFLTAVKFWGASAALWIGTWPLRKGLDLAGIGRISVDEALPEWWLRPATGQLCAQVSDTVMSDAPLIPELLDPSDIPATITLSNLAGVDDPSRGNSVLREEFYKLCRNVAYQIHQLPEGDKRESVVQDVQDAFSACRTRQVVLLYGVLANIAADATDPLEKIRVKTRYRNYQLKQEAFQHLAKAHRLPNGVHAWAFFEENCADHCGLVKGSINGHQAWREGQHPGPLYTAAELYGNSYFSSGNQAYWRRAIKARITPEVLVAAQKTLIKEANDTRLSAMHILTQHLEAQGAKNSNGTDADELDLIEDDGALTQHYCTPNKSGVGYDLNDEGIILLLKLTGDLVDDGRLHTQLTNSEVLRSPEAS